MKEPKRLLSHGATDFERQLLRAVSSERPSALLRSRMQRGLGLVGPLAWASNVKAMFGTVTSRAMLGVAVVGVVVAGGFAAVRWLPSSTDGEALEAAPARELQPPLGVSTDGVSSAGEQARVAPAAPEPTSAARSADLDEGTAAGNAPPALDDDSRLREEIALLDAARAALQRADRDGARATLSAYRERFPSGILRREANVLWGRIEAKAERRSNGAD
jgi:hypothetical protein